MAEPRSTFGPVVLLGLAAGALAAVASTRAWVSGEDASRPDLDVMGLVGDAGEMPLAAALSLVLLACWGVLLVTRGRFRRLVAGLALLSALGLGVSVVVGFVTLEEQVVDALAAQPGAGDAFATGTTAWFWAAAAAAVLSILATAAAVRWAGHWPEMGSRYDAPGADHAPADRPAEDQSSLDLWKAIDEGRDPTT